MASVGTKRYQFLWNLFFLNHIFNNRFCNSLPAGQADAFQMRLHCDSWPEDLQQECRVKFRHRNETAWMEFQPFTPANRRTLSTQPIIETFFDFTRNDQG